MQKQSGDPEIMKFGDRYYHHTTKYIIFFMQDKKRIDDKHDRSSMDRHSRDRDTASEGKVSREQMPPPNARRTSAEPQDDKGM